MEVFHPLVEDLHRSDKAKRRLTKLLLRDGTDCSYCGDPFGPDLEPTYDHVIAQSQGGTSALTNLVLACSFCNGAKNHMSEEAFRAKLERGYDPKGRIKKKRSRQRMRTPSKSSHENQGRRPGGSYAERQAAAERHNAALIAERERREAGLAYWEQRSRGLEGTA